MHKYRTVVFLTFQIRTETHSDGNDDASMYTSYTNVVRAVVRSIRHCTSDHGAGFRFGGVRCIRAFRRARRRQLGDNRRRLQLLPTTAVIYNCVPAFAAFT